MDDDPELRKLREKKMKEMLNRMNMKIKIHVNDANFNQEVIEKSKTVPVVVDFWAEWCVPCKMLGPVIEEVAEDFNGKFVLAKLNVDENPITGTRYNIRSIPNVKLFKDGVVADEFVGLKPKNYIEEWILRNIR